MTTLSQEAFQVLLGEQTTTAQGARAFVSGATLVSNPYSDGNFRAQFWAKGWNQAATYFASRVSSALGGAGADWGDWNQKDDAASDFDAKFLKMDGREG
jgi:hypothetical protein